MRANRYLVPYQCHISPFKFHINNVMVKQMNFQQENQAKQQKEDLENRYKAQEQLRPIKLQNEYNKENLETQHKRNLEIFDKQAELTREIQKKQRNLTITLIIVTAFSTVAASIIGALLITYLGSKEPNIKTHTTRQGLEQISKQINQPKNAKQAVQVLYPETKTKQSAQGESSLNNSSSKIP